MSTPSSNYRASLQGINTLQVAATSAASSTSTNNYVVTNNTGIHYQNDVTKTFEVDPSDFVACYESTVKPCKLIFPFACKPYSDLRASACKFVKRGCMVKFWNLVDPKVRDVFNNSSTCIAQKDIVYPGKQGYLLFLQADKI